MPDSSVNQNILRVIPARKRPSKTSATRAWPRFSLRKTHPWLARFRLKHPTSMPNYSPAIRSPLHGIADDEISAHFGLLPESYFVQADAAEVTLHIQMVNRLLQAINSAESLGALRPVIEWQDSPDGGHTAVHVVTWDRAGLFHKLAGACSVAGLNILAARITTRSDHIAIDTFHVAEPGQGAVRSEPAKALFTRTVEDALLGHVDLLSTILAQAKSHPPARPATPTQPVVDIYREILSPRLIVEIQAPDRIGLLYRVGRVFAEQGFDLSSARVATERGHAVDSFHIESEDPLSLDDARLATLRRSLLSTLTEPARPGG